MLRDHSERSKWSREQAQNLILHIFSHNYDNYSMFRDVPECSGMFWNVPTCSMFRILATAEVVEACQPHFTQTRYN